MHNTDHNQLKYQTQNPLMPFARQLSVYIKLPSNGNFVDSSDYELSTNGEIGVTSMTAADELLLKTPDALLNGESISKIIQSCAPNIKNVQNLPNPDIDALLLAIRLASYGDEMNFSSKCPKCEHENLFAISLDASLANMDFLEAEYTVKLSNNVVVSLRPYTYKSNIKHTLMAFSEGQIMKAIMDDEPDEETVKNIYQENITKMANLLVDLTAECIVDVWDPDGNKIDATYEQITEWVRNIPKKDAESIQEKVAEINNVGIYKKANVTCEIETCNHKWESDINFDPAYFFA